MRPLKVQRLCGRCMCDEENSECHIERPDERSKFGNFNTFRPRSNKAEVREAWDIGISSPSFTLLYLSVTSDPFLSPFPGLIFPLIQINMQFVCIVRDMSLGRVCVDPKHYQGKKRQKHNFCEICTGGMTNPGA